MTRPINAVMLAVSLPSIALAAWARIVASNAEINFDRAPCNSLTGASPTVAGDDCSALVDQKPWRCATLSLPSP